jgi:transcriptional regulator with XRE-family HTH domain/tetratricopeptide (TPR) repeat protein
VTTRKGHIFETGVPLGVAQRSADELGADAARGEGPALRAVTSHADALDVTSTDFGRALRIRRLAAHLSQEALAERAGVSARTISDLERGVHVRPRRATLEALASAFDLAVPEAAPLVTFADHDDVIRRSLPRLVWPRPRELPLVGRDGALAQFREAWARVRQRGRAVVAFTGEPGIGKSRLLTEVAVAVALEGAIVLAGRCDEDAGVPYAALADAVRPSLGDDAAGRVLRQVGPCGGHLALVMPELAARVTPPANDSDRDATRAQLHDAFDKLLALLGAGAPVVLVVDDLHAADPSTVGILRHLARSTRSDPLLIVGSCRSTEGTANGALSGLFEDLARDRGLTRVELGGLVPSDVRALVEAGTGVAPTDAVVDALMRQTGGNPFLIEELVTAGVDVTDGTYDVPDSVRAIVREQVQHLAPRARCALECGAVIGSSFDPRVVARVVGAEAREGLDDAVRAGLLDRSDDRLCFRHDLVRAAILHDLSHPAEETLHWQVGEALEVLHVADLDAHLAEVAHHLRLGALAGDPAKASGFLERAGELQFRSLGLDDAIASLSAALELAPPGDAGDLRRMRILELLAEIHFWREDPDAMRAAALGAAELARRCGTAEDLARTVVVAARWNRGGEVESRMLELLAETLDRLGPGDSAARSEVLALQAYVLQGAGRGFATRSLAEDAEAMARRCDDIEAIALALLVRTYTEAGSPDAACRLRLANELERTAARVVREDHREQYRTFALGARVQAQIARGDRPGFDGTVHELEAVAAWRQAPFLRSQLLFLQAAIALAEGRLSDASSVSATALETWNARPDALRVFAVQTAAQGLERGEHVDVVPQVEQLVAGNASSLGYAARALITAGLASMGSVEEARRRLDELATDGFDALADDHLRPQALRWLCEAIAELRARDAAAALLPIAQPYAGQVLVGPGIATVECAADRAIAQLLATLERFDDAERSYERAAALEHALGFTALELRTRRWRVQLLHDRGDAGDDGRARTVARDTACEAERLGMRALAEACGRLA